MPMIKPVYNLYCCDCLDFFKKNSTNHYDTIFADPPDNIGLDYNTYSDALPEQEYTRLLELWVGTFLHHANTVWVSYNARWTWAMGTIVSEWLKRYDQLEAKPCVQVFTFGQHNQNDLGNNHRPLVRLRWRNKSKLYPDEIRIPSWRMDNGDKRADPRGRVPGDVFDFPRVTGNSRQRRPWCPTQLNEELVARCLRLSTPRGGSVLDPFAGSGTTLRVCRELGYRCTLVELDWQYCQNIQTEHQLQIQHVGPLEVYLYVYL